MRMHIAIVSGTIALTFLASAVVVGADPPSTQGTGPTKAPPSKPLTLAEKKVQAQKAAQECAGKVIDSYMHNKWEDLTKELRFSGKHFSYMTRENRIALSYIRKAAKAHRPKWWKSCRSSSNTSFKASMWGRDFWANYIPSEMLGAMAPVGIRNGKLIIVVTWKPSLVDSTEPAEGYLSKAHGLTKGDIAEAIVWHELGHTYVTNFLPLRHVFKLYEDHYILFGHLQEFYAEMTSVHHSSPLARRAAMLFRIDSLDDYRESDGHTRAAYAIGALILAEVLNKPDQWPSFHLPPKVPEKNIERETIVYLYEHVDPNFTLAEDKTLREFFGKFIKAHGQSVLKSKGKIPLGSKLVFKLMSGDDREHQAKRNAWVKKKLEGAIKSGRADKPLSKEEKKKKEEQELGSRVVIPW